MVAILMFSEGLKRVATPSHLIFKKSLEDGLKISRGWIREWIREWIMNL